MSSIGARFVSSGRTIIYSFWGRTLQLPCNRAIWNELSTDCINLEQFLSLNGTKGRICSVYTDCRCYNETENKSMRGVRIFAKRVEDNRCRRVQLRISKRSFPPGVTSGKVFRHWVDVIDRRKWAPLDIQFLMWEVFCRSCISRLYLRSAEVNERQRGR